jgi:dihydropteroate synthase
LTWLCERLDSFTPPAHCRSMVGFYALSATETRAPPALKDLLRPDRPLVMGVLNVTPDSFSDGGAFFDPEAALAQARLMIAEGADIIDIGAESTRPYGGAAPVSAEEEHRRLAPVLPAVIALGCPVSIDTMKADIAAWALACGAAIVNDVWGFQREPAMANVAAGFGAPVILMHNRADADAAIDILDDIDSFFARSLAVARAAGIAEDQIMLDPGIGFGKTPEQSLIVLAQLDRLAAFGRPLLVGASRKRFIDWVSPAPPQDRLGGSIAAHLLAVANGAVVIRTHDVAPTVQALKVFQAIRSRA